jgi:hypothetical protein
MQGRIQDWFFPQKRPIEDDPMNNNDTVDLWHLREQALRGGLKDRPWSWPKLTACHEQVLLHKQLLYSTTTSTTCFVTTQSRHQMKLDLTQWQQQQPKLSNKRVSFILNDKEPVPEAQRIISPTNSQASESSNDSSMQECDSFMKKPSFKVASTTTQTKEETTILSNVMLSVLRTRAEAHNHFEDDRYHVRLLWVVCFCSLKNEEDMARLKPKTTDTLNC